MTDSYQIPSPIVGFTGRAGSGKDTAATLLRQFTFIKCMAFADPIKEMLCALLGVDRSMWGDRKWKETILPIFGVTPRDLAQKLGTEWGRNAMAADFWIKAMEHKVTDYRQRHLGLQIPIVITDVRFPNEAEWIRSMGGQVYRIARESADAAPIEHVSESFAEGLGVDAVIHNNGSFEDFKNALRRTILYRVGEDTPS